MSLKRQAKALFCQTTIFQLIENGQFETKKYRGDAFAAIHETMEALHEIGAVDKQTMREFDDACLTPVHVLGSG